ncbi:MAG: hypothetical protein QY318_02390 [Candidatus Dojkabacteria bacterium]|nr:MAG: hypothetical protein QY318_02390 [Candidatus Dojkabacteria bacterium]
MSKWFLPLIGILSMVVLAASTPPKASALTCAMPDVDASYEAAELVFEGRVTDVEYSLLRATLQGRAERTEFEVIRTWKGDVGEDGKVELVQGDEEITWGYSFAEGQTYTVFAVMEDGDLKLPLCGMYFSSPYDGEEYYKIFTEVYGDGEILDATVNAGNRDMDQLLNLGGFLLITTLFFGAAALYLRRR